MSEQDLQPQGEGMNPTEEETTTSEDVEVEEEQETPDLSLELEKERKKNYELAQRLKKEKAKKEGTRTNLDTPDVPAQENLIQEQILKANGLDQELVNVLKTIAEEKGITLLEAKKDEYFQYREEKFNQQQLEKQAGLGASKGSGQGKSPKDFSTPNLTAEEHKKLWQKLNK